MKKIIFTTLSSILLVGSFYAQCTISEIEKDNWSIHYVDSEEVSGEGTNNGHAIHAIDNNETTFWHTEWQAAQPGYPHEIQINLGDVYPVIGASFLSRHDNQHGKPKDYELYLSMDGVNWDDGQSAGELNFPNLNEAGQYAEIFFGVVEAQYVKIKFLTPHDNNYYTVLSEIGIFQGLECPVTGQSNQIGTFESITKKYTENEPFELVASVNSSLPITFEIVSGPATVDGNLLTLDGEGGEVTVKAIQEGDEEYYPWEMTRTFQVVDISGIHPEITTRFLESEEIKMTELNAYLLYSYATIGEPEILTIEEVIIEVDGQQFEMVYNNNSHQYWWTPSQYGENTIKITAIGSNGNETTETYTLNVSNDITNLNAVTFADGVIDWGTIGSQWYYGEYELPQFVGSYEEIIANFSIGCPNVPGGCDDWDRLGFVEVKAPDGNWVEIFRYITPYGVACNESIDVTDYASILQGKVEFRMYIETWGTGGWLLNLDFDYIAGTPEYLYSSVEELWHGDYSFGNPANLQPVDTVSVMIEQGVVASKIRLVSTGHGWGQNNTNNAAEFYHAIHKIKVNNNDAFNQDLWQNCNPNPAGCTGQMGTWQYDRAGWCPGSMGMVFEYSLFEYLNQGSLQLSYIFQETYMDICHPNNPNCVSGSTCPDCNDGYNPYYRVGGYIIKYSNAPYYLSVEEHEIKQEINANLYPNPTNNQFKINVDSNWTNLVVSVMDVTGQLVQTRYFDTNQNLNNAIFNIHELPNGMYFIKIQSEGQFTTMKVIKY